MDGQPRARDRRYGLDPQSFRLLVEVYAAGEPAQLDRFTEKLREGSPASQVDKLEILDAPIESAEGFVRRQTL